MGDWALTVFKWALRLSTIMALIVAVILCITVLNTYLLEGVQQNVLNEILTLVQMWLPFDLNVVFTWIWTIMAAYSAYHLAKLANSILNSIIGD